MIDGHNGGRTLAEVCLPAGVAAGVLTGVDVVVEVVAKDVLAGVVEGVDPNDNTAAGLKLKGISVACAFQAEDQYVCLWAV